MYRLMGMGKVIRAGKIRTEIALQAGGGGGFCFLMWKEGWFGSLMKEKSVCIFGCLWNLLIISPLEI